MSESYSEKIDLRDFSFWGKTVRKRLLHNLELELTARCNCDCRHCYINLPAGDNDARRKELSREEIAEITAEVLDIGGFWVLLTGGEPLLRDDFFEIYLDLKRKGYLVSVFTNATVVTREHVELFRKYPPRDVEVSVYGVTETTYERVTRKRGSFRAFQRGLNLLLEGGVKVRFKAMALQSNVKEMPQIAEFCRARTKDYFRFDPFLHLRYDRNPQRNREIIAERLAPEDVIALERNDLPRSTVLLNECRAISAVDYNPDLKDFIFTCTAGLISGSISYDGIFRLCSALWHQDCIYNLRRGNITDAWEKFGPQVLNLRSRKQLFFNNCQKCKLATICFWCPANAFLETGELDQPVENFCRMAHARLEANDGESV